MGSVHNIRLLAIHIDEPKHGGHVRGMMAFARIYGDEGNVSSKQKSTRDS